MFNYVIPNYPIKMKRFTIVSLCLFILFLSSAQTDTKSKILLTGDASDPVVSAAVAPIDGPHAEGTVYTLSMGDPVTIQLIVNNITSYCAPNGSIVSQVTDGEPPYTYLWSNGSTDTELLDLNAGTYSLTVTDAGGTTATASATLTSDVSPMTLDISGTDETSDDANDGTATVVSSEGLSPYTYLWSNGETTATILDLAPGTYTVTVTDDAGCSETADILINPFSCPELLLEVVVTDVSCSGNCDGAISIVDVVNGVAPYTYEWSNDAIGDLCAGNYSVTVTDFSGCTVTAIFTVHEPEALVANAGSTDETEIGDDGTAWGGPAGGTSPYSYQWSNGSTDSLITGLQPGIYAVVLTDANGCVDSAEVEVGEFICFIISENEVQHVFCHDSCDGLIFVVPLGGVGPYEYDWSTGDTANIVFDLCEGWYSVTVTDLGQNGCSSFINVLIVQPDTFYFDIDEIVNLTDTSEASIDVTFHGGTQPYVPVWFGPNGFVSFDEDISDLAPGTYILNLFDSHDCSVTDTIEILDLTTGLPQLPDDAFSIFPNPANSSIHIDARLKGDYMAELYSLTGVRLIFVENDRVLDVKDLATGIYVLRIKSNAGYYLTKVMVE